MDAFPQNGVISVEHLAALLESQPNLKILDATYMVPGGRQSPYDAFLGKRIKGAQFFDIDAVADQNASLAHTVPSPDYFADCVADLGISSSDQIVIYDQSGVYMASSRAWWMFRMFGHDAVCVLEGGLQAWEAQGRPLVSGPAETPARGDFTARLRPELLVNRQDILENIEANRFRVLDARDASRFHGLAGEPRPGMQPGHIPGSANLPFFDLLDRANGTFLNDVAILDTFTSAGVFTDDKLAVSCGSGVTACTVALALFKASRNEAAIYDGSWSEWGDLRNNLPVEKSA